jgi:hypothetical protein
VLPAPRAPSPESRPRTASRLTPVRQKRFMQRRVLRRAEQRHPKLDTAASRKVDTARFQQAGRWGTLKAALHIPDCQLGSLLTPGCKARVEATRAPGRAQRRNKPSSGSADVNSVGQASRRRKRNGGQRRMRVAAEPEQPTGYPGAGSRRGQLGDSALCADGQHGAHGGKG